MNQQQAEQIRHGAGFIAALDQSGGSTPKALAGYGIDSERYTNEAEMYALVHAMRSRIITSRVFTSERIIGAILFERTMDAQIEGRPTAEYLWEVKQIVPFLKVDKGLADEADGARLMKPIPGLEDLLGRAVAAGIFGTKMRSVILGADEAGVRAVVAQQFEIAEKILDAGLVPIIEPEVDIHAPDKAEAEDLLVAELTRRLDALDEGRDVVLKVTIPSRDCLYSSLIEHPRVMRVVALSGGYEREDANARLARNPGLIASFSRALLEGLSDGQAQADFDATLDATIEGIHRASVA
ncbi:fructose bisphosphate aldolase [Actinomyces bowdenii]|uniref:fructose-bisphosphate aldolase n=1 Tax=Actinomyces bowdenii TaxID=131109 RepID=A0A853EHT3_9ACTO|nr:fructose bisphosphate aldolase [Actinomyces bowdenii]MBF0696666.1 fructose bisphosphate aldolase [Actinomyces bowdenii]NYS68839.1 fructose bisphosphate aldolase [Actinomyces bowdenii]